MKPKVYLETSVVSYVTGNDSRDVIVVARQKLTQYWWAHCKDDYDLFISPVVLKEIVRGDPGAALQRKNAVAGIPILDSKPEIEALALLLLKRGSLPANAADDAFHIAWATIFQMDYLLTWNCAHIANASIRKVVERIIREAGHSVPMICTPEELLGEREP